MAAESGLWSADPVVAARRLEANDRRSAVRGDGKAARHLPSERGPAGGGGEPFRPRGLQPPDFPAFRPRTLGANVLGLTTKGTKATKGTKNRKDRENTQTWLRFCFVPSVPLCGSIRRTNS